MKTDVFKSDRDLFAKYIMQNIENLHKMTNCQTIQIYNDLTKEDKYELSTNVKVSHSEGGEVSNPLNNLTAKLDVQQDKEQQYMYVNGQILYSNEEYLQTEIIKQQELYGIRFTDVAKQFVTIKEDENFDTVANNIGINNEALKNILHIIDGTAELSEMIISKDKINTINEKYINCIKGTISNGTFDGLKNAMITYNNETIKANAYSVSLSNEQVENMVMEILNNLKNEKIVINKIQNIISEEEYVNIIDRIINMISEEYQIPSAKITVYERKGMLLRTAIEIASNKITLENIETEEGVKTKIQISRLNTEQVIEHNIEISKNNVVDQESYGITIETINAEDKHVISFENEMKLENNNIILNSTLSFKKDITIKEVMIENLVKIGESFEKAQTLDQSNNVILNDLEEQRRITIIDSLKMNVPKKVETRLNLLQIALGLKEEQNEVTTEEEVPEISEIDINKFNAKFEFYTGDTVSAENVKTLLEIAKNNLASYEITPIENESNSKEQKYNIKLHIEKDKLNEKAIEDVLTKIKDKKKYKVVITYSENNGVIDYITINEVEN